MSSDTGYFVRGLDGSSESLYHTNLIFSVKKKMGSFNKS